MCSKKWAKPDFPGSISLRDPVCTGMYIATMFGKPVGTTMTLRPFGRVFSEAWNGMTSPAAARAATGTSRANRRSVNRSFMARTLTQFRGVNDPRLTHVESAPLPVSLDRSKTKRKEGTAAMKDQAIHYLGLDVHQATIVATSRNESGAIVLKAT